MPRPASSGPSYPILSRWYPPGVQIAVVPFGGRALRHFVYLERPEGRAPGAAGFTAARRTRPPAAGDRPLPAGPEERRGGYVGLSS